MTISSSYPAIALPCGCHPGYQLCEEAVALWQASLAAYHDGRRRGDYRAHEAAAQRYFDHINLVQPETAA